MWVFFTPSGGVTCASEDGGGLPVHGCSAPADHRVLPALSVPAGTSSLPEE